MQLYLGGIIYNPIGKTNFTLNVMQFLYFF